MSTAPVPPRRSNNAIWWILGIIGGGVVLLVLLGLAVAGMFIRRINVNDSGRKVAIETPVGAIHVNEDETHATGLPVYPGATNTDNKNSSVELTAGNSGVGFATEEYQTTDALDKVQTWYHRRLGPEFAQKNSRDQSSAGAKDHFHVNDSDVAFVDDHGDGAPPFTPKGGSSRPHTLRARRRSSFFVCPAAQS
jgi:hypothetical protein